MMKSTWRSAHPKMMPMTMRSLIANQVMTGAYVSTACDTCLALEQENNALRKELARLKSQVSSLRQKLESIKMATNEAPTATLYFNAEELQLIFDCIEHTYSEGRPIDDSEVALCVTSKLIMAREYLPDGD